MHPLNLVNKFTAFFKSFAIRITFLRVSLLTKPPDLSCVYATDHDETADKTDSPNSQSGNAI